MKGIGWRGDDCPPSPSSGPNAPDLRGPEVGVSRSGVFSGFPSPPLKRKNPGRGGPPFQPGLDAPLHGQILWYETEARDQGTELGLLLGEDPIKGGPWSVCVWHTRANHSASSVWAPHAPIFRCHPRDRDCGVRRGPDTTYTLSRCVGRYQNAIGSYGSTSCLSRPHFHLSVTAEANRPQSRRTAVMWCGSAWDHHSFSSPSERGRGRTSRVC